MGLTADNQSGVWFVSFELESSGRGWRSRMKRWCPPAPCHALCLGSFPSFLVASRLRPTWVYNRASQDKDQGIWVKKMHYAANRMKMSCRHSTRSEVNWHRPLGLFKPKRQYTFWLWMRGHRTFDDGKFWAVGVGDSHLRWSFRAINTFKARKVKMALNNQSSGWRCWCMQLWACSSGQEKGSHHCSSVHLRRGHDYFQWHFILCI